MSPPHGRRSGGAGGRHQVPGPPHHLGSLLVPEHRPPGEEGTTTALLPQEAETGWPLLSVARQLLQGHNREHPLPRCDCVVRQQHGTGEETTGTGGQNCSGHRRPPPSGSGLNIHGPGQEEGKIHGHRPQPPGPETLCTTSIRKEVQEHPQHHQQTKEQFLLQSC